MLAIVNCLCGESICHEDGRCKRCGKYRMLPRKLADKAKAVDAAMNDFKDAVIAWMNANAALTGGEAVPSNGVVGHDHQMHRVAEMADAPRPQAPASGQPGHGGEAAGSSPAPVPNNAVRVK